MRKAEAQSCFSMDFRPLRLCVMSLPINCAVGADEVNSPPAPIFSLTLYPNYGIIFLYNAKKQGDWQSQIALYSWFIRLKHRCNRKERLL